LQKAGQSSPTIFLPDDLLEPGFEFTEDGNTRGESVT
jgi:hypothetical protein